MLEKCPKCGNLRKLRRLKYLERACGQCAAKASRKRRLFRSAQYERNRTLEKCSGCGKMRVVEKRLTNRDGLCHTCMDRRRRRNPPSIFRGLPPSS